MLNTTVLDNSIKDNSIKHVAIIGGGLAGQAAAVALAEHGTQVTLFEAASQLGGRARSVAIEVNSQIHTLDNGQHILLGAYRETLALLAKINIREEDTFLRLPLTFDVRSRAQQAFRYKSANYLPTPLNHLLGFFTCAGLNLQARLAAIKLMIALKQNQYQLEQDEPLLGYLKHHNQPEKAIALLWEPLCLAALNTPLHIASTRVFLNVLRDTFQGKKSDSDLLIPKQDLSSIFSQPTTAYLRERRSNILLNRVVKRIKPSAVGYTIHTKSGQLQVSHVVLATSPARVGGLTSELPKLHEQLEPIDQYMYQPIYTIYLQYPKHVALPSAMLGLTGGLSQWVFDRGILSYQPGLMAVIISAEGPHQKLTQDTLALRVAQELHDAFPQLTKPLWHKVIAEKRATFACTTKLVRPQNRTAYTGLYLAGDYTYADYPATIEAAVRSGFACANLINHA